MTCRHVTVDGLLDDRDNTELVKGLFYSFDLCVKLSFDIPKANKSQKSHFFLVLSTEIQIGIGNEFNNQVQQEV
jgi:hypothetical protein